MLDMIFQVEAGILLWIQETLRGPLADGVVLFYTSLGNTGLIWIALSLLMLFFPATRKAGVLGLGALLCSLLVTNLTLKPLVDRIRPYEVIEGLKAMVHPEDKQSFPSGHTSAALAAALAWWGYLPRKWMGVAGVTAAVLMGLSRLYVGVHYPTDVLAGACAGALCAWVVHRICKFIEKKKTTRS